MEFADVVKRRRSVRSFSKRGVSEEVVLSLIECAVQAPSSMNGQPWFFIIVRDETVKRRLAEIKNRYCPPEKREYSAEFLRAAPVIVVTCVARAKAFDRGIETGVLATGHLLLAAADRGLTGVYMSAYKSGEPEVADAIRAVLEIPADIDPITILPIGYPAEPPPSKKLRPVDEVVFCESFGRK